MGWSWALYLANEIVAFQSSLGSGLGADRFLRDKLTVPAVARGPVVGVYVDNVNVIARDEHTAAGTMESIVDRFESLGIPFEVTDVAGERVIESLGLEFRFEETVILRNTSKRTWRLWRATRALLGRHRVSGEVLRVWLGHVNFFFQLARSGLSALSACYRFVACSLGRRRALWPNVRKELRIVLGLLPLVEHDLGTARSEVVHLGDSSTYGFAIMDTIATREEVNRELRVRERWRFLEGRVEQDEEQLIDPDAISGHRFVGLSAEQALGAQTAYGQQFSEHMDSVSSNQLKRKKQQLFGKPSSRPTTLIEAIPHPPVSTSWHDATRWNLIQAGPWKRTKEHINVKEGRVCLMGLRRWARHRKHMGKLLFSLSDNLVVTLAFEKGRSSSGPINHLCRRAGAYVLGCRFNWRLRHIRTDFNVADKPSRWFDPPPTRGKAGPVETSPTLGRHRTVRSLEQGVEETHVQPLFYRDGGGVFCLEIFSGCGGLTSALSKAGLRCLQPLDHCHGPDHDISRVSTQTFLLRLVASGLLWYLHLGTPCTIWSRARHQIRNFRRAAAKERLGVQLATFSARIIRMAIEYKVLFTLENPWGSLLWKFGPIADLLKDSRVYLVVFDTCMFGSSHRKSTAILTNMPSMLKLGRRCDRCHRHVALRGGWKVWKGGRWVFENKTTTAGAYTSALCLEWAGIIKGLAPNRCFQKNGEDHEWFRQSLTIAADGVQPELGGNRPTTAGLQPVSPEDADKIINLGVVFGQHSKQEAIERCGPGFDLSYPRPSPYQV